MLNILKQDQFIFAPINENFKTIKNYCDYIKLNNLDNIEIIDNFYNFIST